MTQQNKRDLSDMFGDPTLDAGDEEPTWHRAEDRQAAEKALRERIAGFDQKAADMGIDDKEWWLQDDPEAAKLHEFRKGLPQEYQRAEWDRGSQKFEGMSRQELDGAKQIWSANTAYAEGLWDDYLDLYGADASPEQVAKAASRVTERWTLDGSRNIARRISKNRDEFLDEVNLEVVLGGYHLPGSEGGEAHRTAGVFGGTGGGRGGPMKDSDEGEPLFATLQQLQKKEGYY